MLGLNFKTIQISNQILLSSISSNQISNKNFRTSLKTNYNSKCCLRKINLTFKALKFKFWVPDLLLQPYESHITSEYVLKVPFKVTFCLFMAFLSQFLANLRVILIILWHHVGINLWKHNKIPHWNSNQRWFPKHEFKFSNKV